MNAKQIKLKKTRMYVWQPPSFTDYYVGLLCVVAASKRNAIDRAVRHVHTMRKRLRRRLMKYEGYKPHDAERFARLEV